MGQVEDFGAVWDVCWKQPFLSFFFAGTAFKYISLNDFNDQERFVFLHFRSCYLSNIHIPADTR